MSASPQNPGLRADAVASRTAIVTAASQLYGARGIDVPFEDIARAAGVGKSTVYRHFATRDDLFDAIVDALMDDFEALAAQLPAGPDRFLALFDLLLDAQLDHPAVLANLPKSITPTPASQARRQRILELFREPLAEAQAAGVVRDELVAEDVRVLFIMVCAVIRKQMPDSERARARHLAHLSMRA